MNIFSLSCFTTGPCQITDSILKPITLLAFRIYVAWVFFASGLTKIKSWDTTIYLFEDEYKVPIIPPEIAAYMATAGELILPVLLVVGLFGRFSALGLFVLNFVAVISYPYLFTVDGAGGYWQHVTWGVMLWMVVLCGSGKLSLDQLLINWNSNRRGHE